MSNVDQKKRSTRDHDQLPTSQESRRISKIQNLQSEFRDQNFWSRKSDPLKEMKGEQLSEKTEKTGSAKTQKLRAPG